MATTRWEDTLYAFAPIKVACQAGRAAGARDAMRVALEAAGLDTSSMTPMTDEQLAGRPAAWLFLYGSDVDDGPFTPFVIPADRIDDDLRASLARVDGQTLSRVEVKDVAPDLWRAWVKVALASGLNQYEDFSRVLDDGDEARKVGPDELSALRERWADANVKRAGRSLVANAFDVRFVGASFLFERL